EEEVAAFLIASIAVGECHVLNISVRPSQQRLGHGRRLMKHLMKVAASSSVDKILLEVRVSNYPAIVLYKQLGFEVLSVRKNYYPAAGGREDAYLLQAILNPE